MTLARAYGGRFAKPGKVHAVRNDPYTECGRAPYAIYEEGDLSEVTCKQCLKAYS